jgi:hypothetical protein
MNADVILGVMPGPPGPAFGRLEDKLDPGIHANAQAIFAV